MNYTHTRHTVRHCACKPVKIDGVSLRILDQIYRSVYSPYNTAPDLVAPTERNASTFYTDPNYLQFITLCTVYHVSNQSFARSEA